MPVTETFLALPIGEMDRATTFYVAAFGATVSFASSHWTSLHVAGVRIGLFPRGEEASTRTGLHFAVDDLAAASDAVAHAGGRILTPVTEVAPGVVVVDAADTEGNAFTLRGP